MVRVDNVRMLMPVRRMPVRMTVGFRWFPSFVVMLMMLVVHMQMLMVEHAVRMLHLAGVVARPQSRAGDGRPQRHRCK